VHPALPPIDECQVNPHRSAAVRAYYKSIIPPAKVPTPLLFQAPSMTFDAAPVFPRPDDPTALLYMRVGGALMGRLPHPSVPLRPNDAGEMAILEAIRLLNLFSPSPQTLTKGHFPTTATIARLGPPLGPPLANVAPQMRQHCRRDWWRSEHTDADLCPVDDADAAGQIDDFIVAPMIDPASSDAELLDAAPVKFAEVDRESGTGVAVADAMPPADKYARSAKAATVTAYDDEAEASLQEAYLRVCFPGLFFGDSAGSRGHLYKEGFCFTGTAWTLGMIEGHTAAFSEMMHSNLWDHDHAGNISDALLRALDEQDSIDGRLRTAGLDSRLWFSGLDSEKLACLQKAASIYRGDSGRYMARGEGEYGHLLSELQRLPVGEILWRTHGWALPIGGHCVIHLYEKTGPHTIAIICCNSGDGLNYHPSVPNMNSPGVIGNFPTCKPIPAMRVDHIDMRSERFNDLGNWHWLDRCQEFPDRLHSGMSYSIGLPYLTGKSLRRAVRDSPDLQGWPSTGQRGATCGYRGPVKAFQYLLRRYGFSKTDIKEATFAQRLFFVAWAGEQLAALRHDAGQTDAPLSSAAVANAGFEGSLWTGAGMPPPPASMRRVVGRSDYLVLDMGCANLALTSLKLHDRGRLTDSGLRLALAVVRRVRQLMPHPSLYWFPIPSPLPVFSLLSGDKERLNSGRQEQMELLLDWHPLDLEEKAGAVELGDFPMLVDPAGISDAIIAAKCLADLAAVMDDLVRVCKAIRMRFEACGEISNSKLHVVGLLHSVFASGGPGGVPIPRPCESRGIRGDVTSLWTKGTITAQLQVCMVINICFLMASLRLPFFIITL
jgi:hypothetical protein